MSRAAGPYNCQKASVQNASADTSVKVRLELKCVIYTIPKYQDKGPWDIISPRCSICCHVRFNKYIGVASDEYATIADILIFIGCYEYVMDNSDALSDNGPSV